MSELIGSTRVDYRINNDGLYDDTKASWGEGAAASVGETFEQLPTVALYRASQLMDADLERDTSAYFSDTSISVDDALERFGRKETIDEDEWKRNYGNSGLKFEPNHSDEFWKLNVELKQAEIARKKDIASSEIGMLSQFALGVGPNLLDPINMASAFVPIAKAAPIATRLAKLSGGPLKKALIGGAIEGGIGNIAPEVMTYGALTTDRQYDYDMWDALTNVGMGVVVGGALQGVFGRGQYRVAQSKILDDITNGKPINITDTLDEKGVKEALDDFKNSPEVKKAVDGMSAEDKIAFEKQIEAEKNTNDIVGKLKKADEDDVNAAAQREIDEAMADDNEIRMLEEQEASFAEEASHGPKVEYSKNIDEGLMDGKVEDPSITAQREATERQAELGADGPGDEVTKEFMETIKSVRMEQIEGGEPLRPGQMAQDKPVYSYGEPILPNVQNTSASLRLLVTETLDRLGSVIQTPDGKRRLDANGNRLVSNKDVAWLKDKSTKVIEKIGNISQIIDKFKDGGAVLRAQNPNMTWKQVADRWGGDAEERSFVRQLGKRFDGYQKKAGNVDGLPVEIMKDIEKSARIQYGDSVSSFVKFAENMDRLTKLAKANKITEANVLLADMIGSTSLGWLGRTDRFIGMKNSVDGLAKSIERTSLGDLRARLEKEGLWKLVEKTRTYNPLAGWIGKGGDKTFQLQIREALWSIDLETGKAKLRTNEGAARVAEIIHEVKKELVDRQNAAGAHIELRKEYGATQRHIRDKLISSGKEAWKKYIVDKLDTVESFGPRTPDEIDKILDDVFTHNTTGGEKKRGYDTDFGDEYGFRFGGDDRPTSLAGKISAERRLIFKDAAAQHDYDMKFGSSDLMDNIYSSITRAAGSIALMNRFGPDPDAVFGKLYNTLLSYKKQGVDGRLDVDQMLLGDVTGKKGAWLQRAYDDVSGKADRPVDITMARIGRGIRAWNNLKLGTATLSSFGDMVTVSLELHRQGMTWMKSYEAVFKGLMSVFTKDADKVEAARLLGIGMDGMVSDVMSRYADPSDVNGRMSKAMGLMFKVNFLERWTDGHKFSAGLMLSSHVAGYKKLDWDGLAATDPKLHKHLGEFGIDKMDWDIIRNHGIKEIKGNDFVLGDMLRNISNDTIQKIAGSKLLDNIDIEVKKMLDRGETGNKAITNEAIKNYRRELGDKLSNFLIDSTDRAVPTPGARQRIRMRGGAEPGTVMGEINRFFWQFKSFPETVFQQAMERAQEEGAVDFGRLLVGLTGAGYVSLMAKDFIQGKEPRIPTFDKKGWSLFLDAMTQGGALGIYGDLVLSGDKRYGQSRLGRFAGPTAGIVEDTLSLVLDNAKRISEGKQGAWGKAGSDALFFTRRHILPPLQFPIVKQMLDYTFLHSLQEIMNPGYLNRIEKNMKKERDQHYFDYGINIANPRNRLRFVENILK